MEGKVDSPRVTDLAWGRLEVEGSTFKDAKLFPGGARAWDWNETGTNHEPGIQPADVEELLERGATTVVLSKGFHERLGVTPETLRMLEERGAQRTSGRRKRPYDSTTSSGRPRRLARSSTPPASWTSARVPGIDS